MELQFNKKGGRENRTLVNKWFLLIKKSVKANVCRHREKVKTEFSKTHLYTDLDLRFYVSKYFFWLLNFKKLGDNQPNLYALIHAWFGGPERQQK